MAASHKSFVVGVLLAVVCAVMFSVPGIDAGAGVRKAQVKESQSMTNFKRSLNPADQALLTKMKSKSRFIEALLDSKKVMDKRDQIVVAKKSEAAQQCCNCNEGSAGCYHPDDVKRSHVIRCCIPVSASQTKRDQVSTNDAQKVLGKLSKADQQLMQRHESKLANLVVAAQQPAGSEDAKRSKVEKKQEKAPVVTADVIQKLREGLTDLELKLDALSAPQATGTNVLDEMSKKFVADVNLAKAKGVKLDDLLAALKKRGIKP